MGGDMQDAWPKDEKPKDASLKAIKEAEKIRSRAARQREAVKDIIKRLEKDRIPVYFTPGNHDINDVASKEDMAAYAANWNTRLYQRVPHSFGLATLIVELNSQLYQNALGVGAGEEKQDQNDWLAATLRAHLDPEKTRLIVVLTHIPPFLNRIDEEHGWGNWCKPGRIEMLSVFARAIHDKRFAIAPKILWVCGHFHVNVESRGHKFDVPVAGGRFTQRLEMDIIVSSSAGTAMWWMAANNAGFLEPKEAEMVASIPVQGPEGAFAKYIMSYTTDRTDPFNRGLPYTDRSGLRMFRIRANGEYNDRWYTLSDLIRDRSSALKVKLGSTALLVIIGTLVCELVMGNLVV